MMFLSKLNSADAVLQCTRNAVRPKHTHMIQYSFTLLQAVDMFSLRSNLISSNNILERGTFSLNGSGVSPDPYNTPYNIFFAYFNTLLYTIYFYYIYHPKFSISQSLFFTLLLHSLF